MSLEYDLYCAKMLGDMCRRMEARQKKRHEVHCNYCHETIKLEKGMKRISPGLANHWCGKCQRTCKCGGEWIQNHGMKFMLEMGSWTCIKCGNIRGLFTRTFQEGLDTNLRYRR